MRAWVLFVCAGCGPGSGFDGPVPIPTPTTPVDTPTGDTATPTTETGTVPTTPSPGLLVINEVLATPPGGIPGDANCDGLANAAEDVFVEIVNVSGAPVDLSGARLVIGGEARHTFAAGVEIAPLGAAVIFGADGARLDGSGTSGPWCAAVPPSVHVDGASSGGLGLTGVADDIFLRAADGDRLDLFALRGPPAGGGSYNRNPDLSSSPPIEHDEIEGASGAFSPGRAATGAAFDGGTTVTTGDPTGDTGVPPGPVATTIYAVQDGTYGAGSEVSLTGVVVTATDADGVVVEASAGGPYSGLYLALGAGWETTYGPIDAGDKLDVTGLVQEVSGSTALDLAASAYPALAITGTAAIPAPTKVTVTQLVGAFESYESVLVEVGQTVVSGLLAGNEFELKDGNGAVAVSVDDHLWLYSDYATLVAGHRFEYVRGVLFAVSTTSWRLDPRSDADLSFIDLALRINEVLGDPASRIGDANCDGAVDAVEDDFVEIWNLGGSAVDLSGMTLWDVIAARHTFAGVVLAPGDGVVVFGGGSPTFDGSATSGTWCKALPATVKTAVASTGSLGITNTGDTISLKSLGLSLDSVSFGAEAASDRSLNRSPELSKQPMVLHDAVVGAVNDWSPGTLVGDADAPYRAGVIVDGDLGDFPADALFTSSSGDAVAVSWDEVNLYVGVEHPAIAETERVVVVYVGDGSGVGTANGLTFGPQQPVLPFLATRALRWSTDGTDDAFATFDALTGLWAQTPGWLGTAGSALAEDDVAEAVEFAIPLAELDVAAELDLVIAIVETTALAEQTVGALPSSAITDGAFDPDYAKYYAFHPMLADAPTSATAVP